MSKQKSCADAELDPEDLNPFSFREFLRWKNQDQNQNPEPDLDQDLDRDQNQDQNQNPEPDLDQDLDRDQNQDPVVLLQSAAEEEEEDEGGQEVRVTFDPEEAGWGRSLQAGADGTEEDEEDEEEETRFSSRPEDQQGGGGGGGRGGGGGGGGGGENDEGDEETSSCRRIQIQQQENVSLRKSIKELQRRSDANELRVLELSEELVQRRSQDQKENQDLESMVQSVEQNLHLMTKRALKAEGCVSKLKVALQQLQSENDRLKAADSEIVMTMRHNAQVASEYLNKTASHAHSSIRQLMGEAESLILVSQLLKSIDKISNHDSES